MSKRGNDGELNEKSKQPKLGDIDPNEIACVNFQNQESSPAIFKLNAIFCDDLFEWLSLDDLHSLGQTCKRMHRLTGIYFKENFKDFVYKYHEHHRKLNGFIEFVQNIEFTPNSTNITDFQYIGENCDSLQQITFSEIALTKVMIDCIKGKLDKIETVVLHEHSGSSSIKFYEDLLKFCPNLMDLRIRGYVSDDNDWMLHEYPKLKHLKLTYPRFGPSLNLELFFQKNAHLQSFETECHTFLKYSDKFINSGLKLNDLNIICTSARGDDEFGNTLILLNKLYVNGFYKRLKLCFANTGISQGQMNQIGTLRGLEKLLIFFYEGGVSLPLVVSLKELYFFCEDIEMSVAFIIAEFPNLRQIDFFTLSMDHLLLFIGRLPQLKVLRINIFGTIDSNDISINLQKLNEERRKLPGACKVTIHVQETVYLQTKMTTKNLYAKHNLIEIKRHGSDLKIANNFYEHY